LVSEHRLSTKALRQANASQSLQLLSNSSALIYLGLLENRTASKCSLW